jgi:hypothetical protein
MATNIVDVEFLRKLQADLAIPAMEDEPLRARLASKLSLLEAFARKWQEVASEQHPSLARVVNAAETGRDDGYQLDISALRVSMARLPA